MKTHLVTQTSWFRTLSLIVFVSSLTCLIFELHSYHPSSYSIFLSHSQSHLPIQYNTNISNISTNYSIDSFWNHADLIQKYYQLSSIDNINQQINDSILYSYSYQELEKIYEVFGCGKQQQANCQNGISSTCKIHELILCDMPKLVNNGANCNLNDLQDTIINSYKQNRVPKIYHIVLQFNGNDINLRFFNLMYYLTIKSYHKFGEPVAIILHYIVLNKKKGTNIDFKSYKNKYFQDSLKFITHFCEWHYIPTIFGNRYGDDNPARSGNMVRIFATTLFGGIYYDLDVFMFNQTDTNFDELLDNNPSHTMIPKEAAGSGKWILCSSVLIARRWSIFNIEWIYQLKNEMYQLRWKPTWSRVAVHLPKRIADQIFIGNDSFKYINQLDSTSYFYATWWDKSPWKNITNNRNIHSKKTLWCNNHTNVYGWHYWNHAQKNEVKQFWERAKYNISFAKQQTHIPFTRILKHIEDNVPLCHN